MFELKQVTRSFGVTVALAGIDLSIGPGETTVLIGSSGCGKSTLLRLILGLIEPTAGEVTFDGERLVQANLLSQRRRMGYVIQGGGLFPHLTAEGNVALMARHLGWSTDRIRARIEELSSITRVDPALLGRYPSEISGGQAQRVALMRALMLDPPALLLDEPLGALDPIVRAELQDELRGIFRSLGKTVVLVTHDLAEARFFGDTIVLLEAGRILQCGSFEDLVERPAAPFVKAFVGAQRSRAL